MLTSLDLKNITAFPKAKLKFSTGLNVIVGENGTGKTHLLKLGYLVTNAGQNFVKQDITSEQKIELYFSEHLRAIFKPDRIGSLTTSDSDGKSQIVGIVTDNTPVKKKLAPGINLELPPNNDGITWQLNFSNRSKDNIVFSKSGNILDSNSVFRKAIYLPSKEMISFFDGFLALYDKHEIPFDETYRDLALHLSTPKLKSAPKIIQKALTNLSDDIGGTLSLEGGKFYLSSKGNKPKEITLVAEGIRKIATLMHLIENGSLIQGDTLFWDEPESNLNAKLIKDIASAILFLCQNGMQVIIATHSLFLLRELEILSSQEVYKNIPQRYFSLKKKQQNVVVHQGNSVDDIEPLVMLDESLMQSERFMEQG